MQNTQSKKARKPSKAQKEAEIEMLRYDFNNPALQELRRKMEAEKKSNADRVANEPRRTEPTWSANKSPLLSGNTTIQGHKRKRTGATGPSNPPSTLSHSDDDLLLS